MKCFFLFIGLDNLEEVVFIYKGGEFIFGFLDMKFYFSKELW